ncbi:LIM domain only protein 7-like isoform X6 [Anabas testudineus]|uniref:LIM domain only protein 7-like isoform X6 n=1 Tax=Anabas testudineus TaxID=64144 RepID=UPI000E45477D|nr:LIM domain only protein 7-like isoform X6 [Anabas testudineus]
MEWRQQTTVSCAEAFNEAQRWIEEVTGKSFGSNNFRAALENGVLLCDLINQLKPGIIKRLNRLSTPIAGLDNVNVFLKACGKLGLNESQLFHSGDLQDLSTRVTLRQDEGNRRLKNVLITIYWLGRKAHQDAFYSGPQLNFKAFEGLLGLALSKSLDEGGNVFVKDNCYPEREEWQRMGPIYKRQSSVDSVDSLDSRHLYPNNEGCGSDAEAEQEFRMEATQPSTQQHKGYIPPPLLRRKQRQEVNGRGCASPLARPYQNQVRPERPVQVNPGWIWSKSLSDIPMVYPVRKGPSESTIYDVDQNTNMAGEWDSENKRANSVGPKDGEAHWHDELTKWKNRRRSTKSDLRTMSQDREHVINQMTNGAVTDFKNEMQSRQLKRCGEKSSPCTPKTSVFRDQQASCRHNPAPRPYSTSPPSKPLSAHLRPRTRALLARSYATEAPFSPTVSLNSARSQEPPVTPDGNVLGEETHIVSLASDGGGVTTPSQDCPFSSQTQVKSQPKETIKLASCISRSQEEGQKTSWEPAVEQGRGQQAAGPYKNWSSSASLPRGFRRSEGSSRLSTAITARPFGTKPSRVSSLKRYNVDHSDMRVSLSLKPNSRQDFGFHTYWDSTGTRVKFIEAGSPAELCQLCVDDEIVAVDGVSVANMNENQWKDKLTHALQNGSLTMDIRRYGNKGGSESAISDLQVPSLNPSSSSWSWDCEEDRRRQEKWQEEQERLLQEKYKQDQERMEAEWQKAQQDAMGDLYKKAGNTTDGISGGESPASTQPHVNGVTNKTREAEWSPDRDQLKEAGSKSQSNAQGVQNDIMTGSDCLSPAHRTKSLSTPVLSAPHKQPGDQRKRKGQSVSQAEQDRKQILEEMKKRNHLLTDNSWIRQRNAGFYKEPADTGFPLKKHESLDNLDILNQSPVFTTTLNYPRPHSAAAGYSVPSRNSSSRYSTGAILSQRNASGDYSHHGSVWAATDTSEELRLESRFDSETGSPTVSPAISNSSPLVSPPCDQHAILHIAE